MGNILATASENKATVLSGLSTFAILAYLIHQAQEKKNFRRQMIERMSNNKPDAFEGKINDIYLKDLVPHANIRNEAKNPIYKIAITGGPSAGKSTCLQKIKSVFTEKGYRVLCVPETPTMVVYAGGMILMSQFNCQQRVRFQALLIKFQMYAEDYFTKIAEMSDQPSIVLCDRGTVDPYAYIPNQEFQAVLDEEGWTLVTLRDRRYDRVIFMNSAAVGAEQFYTLANNAARSEGLETARELDKKTLEAWSGHPHLTIVPNVKGESFDVKIDRAIDAVAKTVGQEMKNVIMNKYLIKEPIFPEGLKREVCSIEETFLKNDDPTIEEDKLKKRGAFTSFTYQRKYKYRKQEDTSSQQVRKPITSLQYVTMKESQDPDYNTIIRDRVTFVYQNHPYHIDVYKNILGEEKVHLLRFNSKPGQEQLELIPDFIQIVRDVRKQNAYKLRHIAKKEQ